MLSTICAARRNPRVGPLCPTPLFAALAPCLGNGLGPFSEHRTECAGEFLIALLSELSFQPNSLSLTKEEGMCPLCGVRQEVPHLTHSTMIQLPLPNQVQPIDVGLLLGNVRQNPPVPTLSCTTGVQLLDIVLLQDFLQLLEKHSVFMLREIILALSTGRGKFLLPCSCYQTTMRSGRECASRQCLPTGNKGREEREGTGSPI